MRVVVVRDFKVGTDSAMVERSDRAPLLDWEEVPSAEKPEAEEEDGEEEKEEKKDPPASLGCSDAPGFGWSTGPGGGPKSVFCPDTDAGGPPPATSITTATADADADAEQHPSDATPDELDSRMVKWEEKDQIVSVFVVTFNTRSGEAQTYTYIYMCSLMHIMGLIRVGITMRCVCNVS